MCGEEGRASVGAVRCGAMRCVVRFTVSAVLDMSIAVLSSVFRFHLPCSLVISTASADYLQYPTVPPARPPCLAARRVAATLLHRRFCISPALRHTFTANCVRAYSACETSAPEHKRFRSSSGGGGVSEEERRRAERRSQTWLSTATRACTCSLVPAL
eukprot:3750401-Pleurochrysis_carterae.AAC.2